MAPSGDILETRKIFIRKKFSFYFFFSPAVPSDIKFVIIYYIHIKNINERGRIGNKLAC